MGNTQPRLFMSSFTGKLKENNLNPSTPVLAPVLQGYLIIFSSQRSYFKIGLACSGTLCYKCVLVMFIRDDNEKNSILIFDNEFDCTNPL